MSLTATTTTSAANPTAHTQSQSQTQTFTMSTSLVGDADTFGSVVGCPRCSMGSSSGSGFGVGGGGGGGVDEDAQARIVELEEQIRVLNEKAVETAQKLADYEEQVLSLRSQAHKRAQAEAQQQTQTAPITPTFSPELSQPEKEKQPQTRLATFASYLPYGRRSTTNTSSSSTSQTHLPAPPSTPPRPATATAAATKKKSATATELSLQDALSREQALRKAAETRLSQTHSELEDLTASLFGQANEMVAAERRARAKLEERIEVLERRDGEKRRRLERLERAMERVERVRGLVGSSM